MAKSPEPRAYVLYLDDSGTKEYSPGGRYHAGNTRHFVFGGPILRLAEVRRLTARIRRLKHAAFGTDQVEIKSNWLRIERERERQYLRRFAITSRRLDGFVEDYYSEVLAAELEFVACVVDKQHMKDMYGHRAWYPPAAAYEPVLQRGQNKIYDDGRDWSLFVVVDDMSGATPKGRQYRANLRNHHKQLRKTGSRLWPGFSFPNLRGLSFVNSARSHMVQVADIVAYNVYRQFREYGEEWETLGLAKLPTYNWFARVAGKFRSGPEGRIQGYGVVKMPLLRRVRWRVED